MRKIFKIKLLNVLKKYNITLHVFIFFLIVLNANAQEKNELPNDSSKLEYLPGEEVITNTGKKMNVWTTKGSFKLDDNLANINDSNSSLTPPQILVVREDKNSKRRRQRRNRK